MNIVLANQFKNEQNRLKEWLAYYKELKICDFILVDDHSSDNSLNEISKESAIVFDPFLGSGTTAVACERLGRKWIGCELEPKYVEIANKRIEAERMQLKLF